MTGIVYDENFTVHKCLWDENYSENPQRYTSILNRCNSLGLIDRCVKIETRHATKEELLSKHTVEHIDLLKSTENLSDEMLENMASNYDSIYFHPYTYKQSLLAAGSSVALVKAVADGCVQNGMALIRPPGHHAMKSEYCGYCFFNNVAITTQHLLDTTNIQKILIVDWDIHHGQATQQMFYDDPRVLYFSIHRYEHGRFWPNLRESDFDHIGRENGTGFNVNVPLNDVAMKNEDYMAIVHYLLIPLATEFSPDLIIISSGYDSAIGDPKGEMLVTPACYAHITQKLMNLVHGKIIAILEGGYYTTSLAESAALTLRALLGDPCPIIPSLQQPCISVMKSIRNVIYAHRNYWKCFKHNILENDNSPESRYNFFDEKPKIYQTRNMYPKTDTMNFDLILNQIINETKLFNPQVKLGVIFKMIDCFHKNQKESDIYQYLESNVGNLHILKERRSTIKELNLVYSTEYIKEMFDQQKYIDDKKNPTEMNDNFIDVNSTLNEYCFNIGSLLTIIDSIFENEIRAGISAIGPLSFSNPNENKNVCILNAPMISAKYGITKYFLKRVLIIEWNEKISQNHLNNQILIISVLRLLNNLKIGTINNKENHVNISWPKEKLNDAEFTALMHYLILPIAYEYNPELIILSTKFYIIDGLQMTPIMYGYLILWLSTLAGGRLILWEQSSDGSSVFRKQCLLECSKALLGQPLSNLKTKNLLNSDIKEILSYNLKMYNNIWKSLQYS